MQINVIDRYDPSFCTKLLDHMQKGYSINSFGGELGVTRSTIYRWFEKYPEFRQAKELGEQLALKFFEKQKLAFIEGDVRDKAKANVLIFTLKTRFHETYGERQKLENDIAGDCIVNVTINKPDY